MAAQKRIIIYHKPWALQKKDYGFVMGIVLILLLLFYLLRLNSFVESISSGRQIGVVIIKKNIVQRKATGKLFWEDAVTQYPTYEKDVIRTGGFSSALIRLTSSIEIDIDENTMIVLDLPAHSKSEQIQLNYGSLRVRQEAQKGADEAESGASSPLALDIRTEDQKFRIEGKGSLLLNKQRKRKKLDLAVLQGASRITMEDGKQLDIGVRERAIIQQSGLKKQKLSLELKQPPDGGQVFGAGSRVSVRFGWSAARQLRSLRIKVSRRSNFSTPVVSRKIKGNSVSLALAPGVYYWRVSARESARTSRRTYSASRKLTISSKGRLLIYRPATGSQIKYKTEPPLISFAWNQNEHAFGYILRVAKDPKLQKTVKKHSTLGNNFVLQLPEGKYYWRVATQNVQPDAQVISALQSFSISRHKAALPIQIYRASLVREFSQSDLLENGFIFRWQDNPEVSRTDIVFARNASLSRPIIRQTTGNNFYELQRRLPTGRYYWRLRSKDRNGNELFLSAVHSFAVKETATVISDRDLKSLAELDSKELTKIGEIKTKKLSLNPLEDIVPELPKDNALFSHGFIQTRGVVFLWNQPKGEWSFELIIARDPAFKKIVFAKKLTETKFTLNSLKGIENEGRYNWKVNAWEKLGKGKYKGRRIESKPRFFRIAKLAEIRIKGMGSIKGRIISSDTKTNTVEIITSFGVLHVEIDRIESIVH